MKKSKKQQPADEAGQVVPKIYSIETPYGFVTFLEGHGDNDGQPFVPGTEEAWEEEMQQAPKTKAPG